MKTLTLFLCFTIILQIFTTCKDTVARRNGIAAVLLEHQDIERAANKQHTEDLCSPFCQCSCCATPTVADIGTIFCQSLWVGQTSFKNWNSVGYIDIHLPIWQPPQWV